MDRYFVVSNGDEPTRIFFTLEDAKADESPFIDIFDENGNRVDSLKMVDGCWTNDF